MCLYPVNISNKYIDYALDDKSWFYGHNKQSSLVVPCGKCVECLQDRSIEWSYRLMLEASLYKDNIFLTLTYKDNPISLNKRDLQLFIKSLRAKIYPKKIRYFACGEYGAKGKRPHYHLIIFNYIPEDIQYWKSKKGNDYFLSKMISDIWKKGFITIGKLTLKSCKYCAKYLQKLNDIDDDLVKPFLVMSNRRGIGFGAIDDNWLFTDKIYIEGNYRKIPRYFLKVFEERGYLLDKLKDTRKKKCELLEPLKKTYENKRKIMFDLLDGK